MRQYLEQLAFGNWLGQMRVESGSQRALTIVGTAIAGQRHEEEVRSAGQFPHRPSERVAVEARQPDVDESHVRTGGEQSQ